MSEQRLGSFYLKQPITITRISDEDRRRMYVGLERHIGKEGVVVEYDLLEFDNSFYVDKLPRFITIYTVKLQDGDIIQVPGEMLSLLER